jgi:hypothetical protein
MGTGIKPNSKKGGARSRQKITMTTKKPKPIDGMDERNHDVAMACRWATPRHPSPLWHWHYTNKYLSPLTRQQQQQQYSSL